MIRRLAGRVPWEKLSWSVVNIGVGVMIGLFIAAFALTRPDATTPDALPDAPPVPSPTPAPVVEREPFRPPETDDAGSPVPTSPAASRVTAVPSRRNSEGSPPTRPPAANPAPRTVTGRYRLMDSYGDSFIGEVLLTNVTSAARGWTVQLRFPTNVGGLRTAWVEGAPQATLRWSGRTAIFTSTASLGPGSSVPLRFHFDRTGADVRPEVCTANGTPCS
jgi:hypothetical protein